MLSINSNHEPSHGLRNFFIIVVISTIAISIFFSPKEKIDIQKVNTDFARFVEIFSADNVSTEEKMKNNYSFLREVEETVKKLEHKEVSQYFSSSQVSQTALVNCMYILYSLGTFYTYNDHDGIKARKILTYAKKIAEGYVKDRNKSSVDFDKLSSEEIYRELDIIKDLPEMYARVVYSLARTYTYQGKSQDAARYFELTRYLGDKLNLFEAYLSVTSGLEVIRRDKIELSIKQGEYESARKEILSSIEALRDVISVRRVYRIDCRPNNVHSQTIVPIDEAYSRVVISEQLVKHYARLVKIVDNREEVVGYAQKIFDIYNGSKSSLGLLLESQEVVSKRTAGVYNVLGMILMLLIDKDIDINAFKGEVVTVLKIKDGDNLSVIEQIFHAAKEKSRKSDFTKPDAYNGLMLVYKKKLAQKDITDEQKLEIEKNIKHFQEERDEINKNMNRVSWEF